MAPVFQTLGEFSSWLEASPGVRVVDPGIPLTDYTDGTGYGDVWSSQPSVRKVVDFIARNIASIPFHVYDRVSDTDRRRITEGPLAETVTAPSTTPGMTPYRFYYGVIVDSLLYDRFAIWKTTENGRTELARIPARRFHLKSDGLDRIKSVVIWDKNGRKTVNDPADFILDSGWAHRGANGTSPMDTLRAVLDEQVESIAYRRSVWKRGARIPGVILRPNPWPADGNARERFRTSWEAFTSGGGREGGTPILEDGMDYKPLEEFTPQDTGDLEGRRLSDAEVASAFHIPPELVGAREGTYSNIEAFRQMLYRDALGPYVTMLEQAINGSLTPDLATSPDHYVEANVEAKLRGGFEEQARVLQSATGAPWLTRNESRARQNLPAVEGGDELVTPLNVTTGGLASPRDTAPPVEVVPALESATRQGVQSKTRLPTAYEGKARQVLSRFFRRQRSVVLSVLGAKAERAWWDEQRWDTELGRELYGLAMLVSHEAGTQELTKLGVDPSLLDEIRTIKFLTAVAVSRAAMINSTTRDQLASTIDDPDPDNTPAKVFDVAENSRAVAAGIALVTTFSAFGTTEAAKQVAGDRATKTWVTTSNNPRAEHAAMHGQTVGIDEKFSNGADWPGDPILGADGVSGCMCDVEINIPERV